MINLMRRDMTLAFRQPADWLLSLVFFVLFLVLCVIALDADMDRIGNVAGALIWLALFFSVMLRLPSLFAEDANDGTLEQYVLAGLSPLQIVGSRLLSFSLTVFLPLILITPFCALILQIPKEQFLPILLSVLLAAPAILAYCIMTAALVAKERVSSFLTIILTAPLLIPILIFGLGAIETFAQTGFGGTAQLALIGIDLIAIAIALPAAAAALATNLD